MLMEARRRGFPKGRVVQPCLHRSKTSGDGLVAVPHEHSHPTFWMASEAVAGKRHIRQLSLLSAGIFYHDLVLIPESPSP